MQTGEKRWFRSSRLNTKTAGAESGEIGMTKPFDILAEGLKNLPPTIWVLS
jgi:hypothetical protein